MRAEIANAPFTLVLKLLLILLVKRDIDCPLTKIYYFFTNVSLADDF
jgi:hypothetical protein